MLNLADAIASAQKSQGDLAAEDAKKVATASAVIYASAKLNSAQTDDLAEAAKVTQVAARANADLDALIEAAGAAKRP